MKFFSGGDALFAEVIARHSSTGSPDPRSSSRQDPRTLVLLHPTPLNHRFWLPLAPSLEVYRLVLPDLRGHGRSPLGSVATASTAPVLTIEQLGRDLVALLDALDIDRAVVAGCSIGGYALYELWRVAPGRLLGAVFLNSKPQADTVEERAKRRDWIARHEAARLRGEDKPTPEFLAAMLTSLLCADTRDQRPDLVAEIRAMMEEVRPEAIAAIQRGLAARPDSRATAATFSLPSCVIAGKEDASSTPSDLAALHALLSSAGGATEYHEIDRAGHYAPIEQPRTVAAILDAFCNRRWNSAPV